MFPVISGKLLCTCVLVQIMQRNSSQEYDDNFLDRYLPYKMNPNFTPELPVISRDTFIEYRRQNCNPFEEM
jgi:hypothetical protein